MIFFSVPFSLSSFSGISVIHMIYLWSDPTVLEYSGFLVFFFLLNLFPLRFSGLEVSMETCPQAQSFYFQLCQTTNKAVKCIQVLLFTIFCMSVIYFLFFLRVFVSLLTSPICPGVLSTLSIRTQGISIAVVLCLQSVNSSTSAALCLVLMLTLSLQTVFSIFYYTLLFFSFCIRHKSLDKNN